MFANQQDNYDHPRPALHDNNIYFDIGNSCRAAAASVPVRSTRDRRTYMGAESKGQSGVMWPQAQAQASFFF